MFSNSSPPSFARRAAVLLAAVSLLVLLAPERMAVANIPPFTSPSPHHYQPKETLAKGKFLVASENMHDRTFYRTVIFLIDYGWNGASGVIVNSPMDIPLERTLPGVKGTDAARKTLWFGGPVGMDRLTLLIRSALSPSACAPVIEGVCTSSSVKDLKTVIKDKTSARDWRVYLGYSGWLPGQLEAEVMEGGWYVTDAAPKEVFSKDPSKLWKELLARANR